MDGNFFSNLLKDMERFDEKKESNYITSLYVKTPFWGQILQQNSSQINLQSDKTCLDKPAPVLKTTSSPLLEKEVSTKELQLEALFIGEFDHEKSPEGHQLLEKMITAMGLKEGEYCIRPIQEKDPLQQITSLHPKVVISMGALATKKILKKDARLSQLHGKFISLTSHQEIENSSHPHNGPVLVPLFHPDYLLINPKMKRTAWDDMQKIMSYLKK